MHLCPTVATWTSAEMTTGGKTYKLFEVTGIELDLMVVDRDTLRVRPIVDTLFEDLAGALTNEVSHGKVTLGNQQVCHVVEMKAAKPTKRITGLRKKFIHEIGVVNAALAKHNATLLPTAAHPFMDPAHEAVFRQDARNELRTLYDRHFGCRTHGWSNGQSTYLNLSFANDAEFSKLHAALRLLLPIIPALSASSPILDGKATGFLDSRMEAYLHHQDEVPELMGTFIPEAVFSQEDYYRTIFSPIAKTLASLDTGSPIDHYAANSRGAVARFDRGNVEVRVIDSQECPGADLAIAELIVVVLKAMTSGRWVSTYLQRAWSEHDLLPLFLQVIKDAGNANLANRDYLLMFGLMKQEQMSAHKLWQHIFVELYGELSDDCRQHIAHILEHGCLAHRILKHTGKAPDHTTLMRVYGQLAICLAEDRAFV